MTRPVFNIHDVQANFSHIVDEVAAGAEIIITKAGQPMARLVPIATPAKTKTLGLLNGKITVSDDFNASAHHEKHGPFEGN
jgi:prevent-host-death family protein